MSAPLLATKLSIPATGIYSKLEVNGRAHAAIKARELGILKLKYSCSSIDSAIFGGIFD